MFFGAVTFGGFAFLTKGVTVTAKVADALLPCASLAEHDTVVVPIGNVDPDAGEQVTATLPSTRSLADAVNVAAAPDALVAASVRLAGTVTTAPSCHARRSAAAPASE